MEQQIIKSGERKESMFSIQKSTLTNLTSTIYQSDRLQLRIRVNR